MGIFQQFPYSNFHEMNLDQIIKIMRELQDEWNATKTEWASYKDFIDNYFANLDVSSEVLQAIRTMASTGELNTVIDPVIASETADWLAEHITITEGATVIDDTLSIQGAAADAKATGKAINDLKSDLSYFEGVKDVASSASDWEQGEFITSTGADTDAVNRIRTIQTGVPQNVKFIEAINGYKFLVYAWSENDYLGIWNGTGFTKTAVSGLTKTKEDLRVVYNAGAKLIRIVLMRSTESESIAPSEGINLIYTLYENDIPLIKNRVSALESFEDAVKITYQKGNLYQAKTDDVNNRYYYRNSSGVLSVGVNTDYVGFIVPVLPNRTYTFTRSHIVLLKQDKTPLHTTGGNYDYAGTTKCYSESAYYFAVSVARVNIPETGYVMSMGDALDDSDYVLGVYSNPTPEDYKISHKSLSGSLSDGQEYVISGKCGIRDGYYAAFLGKFSSFNTLTLKFNGFNVTNKVTVTADNLVIVSGIGNTITQAHGLTISNAVQVLLELKNSIMYITVASGGIKYTYNCPWYWTGSSPCELSVTASGMSFTYAKISAIFKSAERKIWYFGDSYSEFNMDSRLPYYVIEYGFDKNLLFNSISGATSALGTVSIDTLLEYGTPKYAINALGMNDGSDSNNTTPNATWLTNVQSFIDICERHNIIPVLCTIPTIPSVNNNGKNAWVKASGYRYIDMADAVGADGTGTWYTGMIGQDNIHPSPLGAVAQFMRLLTDMPEVMG